MADSIELLLEMYKVQVSRSEGIDKLTCRRGLVLPDRGINALYINASAHAERLLRSKDA